MIRMARHWLTQRTRTVVASLLLAAISAALAISHFSGRAPAVLRMSAGAEGTRRHAIAEYLRRQALRQGLVIDLEAHDGSEACLDLLKRGQLDAAIISSGVVVPQDDQIMVLGALQREVVHLLVRPSLAEAGPLVPAIRGKRVNVGQVGSTEWLLAREFLKFARLDVSSEGRRPDVVLTHLGKGELIARARAILQADDSAKARMIAELPDCLLILASMPSTIAQLLVEAADYRLAPLPATRAFVSDNLQDSDAATTTIQREFLERAIIPSHSYFAARGFPETDCETVGMRALLVARHDTSSRALRPLMETVFQGEFSRRISPVSPRDLATPYPIHPAAVDYLDRDKPLATAAVLEWLSNGFSLLGAFSAGALSLYGLLWRRKARKPVDYYAQIRRIDRMALGELLEETVPRQPQELVKYLDEHLLRLRQDFIEDICHGRIKGDQVIANILLLLRDTRRNLSAYQADGSPATVHERSTYPQPTGKAA